MRECMNSLDWAFGRTLGMRTILVLSDFIGAENHDKKRMIRADLRRKKSQEPTFLEGDDEDEMDT